MLKPPPNPEGLRMEVFDKLWSGIMKDSQPVNIKPKPGEPQGERYNLAQDLVSETPAAARA